MTITRRALLGLAGSAVLLPRWAWAQAFPAQTIRIVVPYPPAGPTDAVARIIAQELQSANGWTVVVDNKPGASAALGSREVARAEPDGHTIILGTNQSHATNAILLKICQNEQTEEWAQDWKYQIRVCDSAGAAILPSPTAATSQLSR